MTDDIVLLNDRLRLPPCPAGKAGNCCKGCFMGPCRIMGNGGVGVCGVSHELVTAKNLLRTVTAGAAAHCGHAAHLLRFLGKELPEGFLKDRAPEYLYKAWRASGLLPVPGPGAHFRELSEAMHVSGLGMGADWRELLKWCLKVSLVDGYYGMLAATALEDGEFGRPEIREGRLNLGCLSVEKVNIAVHGHEPALVAAITEEALRHRDVNLVGVCCTGATLLSARGVPLAAHFTLQEDVIATGLVEALVVDSQCIMPSLPDLCECFHTRLITTSPLARLPGAIHLPITSRAAVRLAAKKAVALAIRNKGARKRGYEAAFLKDRPEPRRVVVGFGEENTDTDGLAAKLKSGELKGVIAAVGCVNPRADASGWVEAFRELSGEYLILTTGCMAFELGRHGLLAGKKVLHLGSCVNNARIAGVFGRLAERTGRKIAELPLLVSCPMPITEKSVAIGVFFAALGCRAHFGGAFPLEPGSGTARALGGLLKKECGGELLLEPDPGLFVGRVRRSFPGRKSRRRAGMPQATDASGG